MKLIYKSGFLFSLLLSSIFFFGAQSTSKAETIECSRWEITQILFQARVPQEQNPFDVSFGAVFTHESGLIMNIPGFYNSNSDWLVRFSLSTPGNWKYITYSSLPRLEGKTGNVEVMDEPMDESHGAIRIDPANPARFIYEDGTPYFSIAFEIDWLFALDAANADDIPRTRQIVGYMKDNGFNKAIMNVFAYDAGWGERDKIDPRYNFASPDVFPFGGTNVNPDHTILNVEFFQRFDRVMSHLNDMGIVSHLMIYVWNKKVNWPVPDSPEDNRYFDYIVKRYQAYPNLIWDVSKEALAYGRNDMDYITGRIERLRRLDGHERLVTVHDYSYCRAFPEKIDFISVQEWRPNLYDEMQKIVTEHPRMPIFNVEHGGYEKTMHSIFNGAYTNAETCLERNYLTVFAGTYSTYYWQNTSWYEVVYAPFSLPEENRPKFEYFRHLASLFNQFNFNTLKPDQFFYSTYALGDGESDFLFLVPSGMTAVEGTPPNVLIGQRVVYQWFNPLTGEFTPSESRTLGDWMGFSKPRSLDSPFAVLIIQKP